MALAVMVLLFCKASCYELWTGYNLSLGTWLRVAETIDACFDTGPTYRI